mgnify:CR=1 FL=1
MKIISKLTAISAVLAFSSVVQAAPVTYLAADNNVSSLGQMVNASAAAASFLSVAGSLNTVDFESSVPANLSISGGSITNSNCGAVCGFNTTSGGSKFVSVVGGSVTFTFSNPVDAFGFFVTGLQTNLVPQQTIVYVDGSSVSQTINMPSAINGGGAFVGFIDYGQLISSVTFNATNDILAFDDLRFGRSEGNPVVSAVPEPETYAMMLAGLGVMGTIARRRKAKQV